MSVIRKKPEIEKIINDLTDTQKAKLLSEVNNTAPIAFKQSFDELSNNQYEIIGALLEFAPTDVLPGIIVRTNNSNSLKEHFIQFGNGQNLILYKMDTANKTFEKIDEELDINELRRVLNMDIIGGEIEANDVEANPTLAGSEALLTGLEVDGVKYAVPQPTSISANPELVGTEAELTSIEIGGTKYKIPQKEDELPTLPTTEGAYVLTCTVDSEGVATLSWEAAE